MCGIVGIYSPQQGSSSWSDVIHSMSDTLFHRGPDSAGHWMDLEAGIALGHRRLAIIDLSKQGYQPMESQSGRYVIVFNGEIYNYLELKAILESASNSLKFRGTSDTEVLLAAIEYWGINETLSRLVGMFAFAVWDRAEHTLYLCRDRMGEKPLYYGWVGKVLLFGSELKSLRSYPYWKDDIDIDALALLMRFGYIPAPYSIYKGIYKLPHSTYIRFNDSDRYILPTPNKYWDIKGVIEAGASDPFDGNEEEILLELESKLLWSIRQQMIADVPLGAFLSGGIDSSLVVSLMQTQSSQPIKTFSIGFNENLYNEAPIAKKIATYLETDHTEVYVTPKDTISVIPKLPKLYDEPFSDSSQIPTFIISSIARLHVTVSLSGDGGDELFAGYPHYFWALEGSHRVKSIPVWLQSGLSHMLLGLPSSVWQNASYFYKKRFPDNYRNPIGQFQRILELLPVRNTEHLYYNLISRWRDPTRLVLGANELNTIFTSPEKWPIVEDPIHLMTFFDMECFLANDGLVKVDRAGMGASLETRLPMLDYRLIEFAARIPLSMKVRNRKGKWLLRQLLYRHIPKNLVDHPKSGFAVPIDQWLRHELRDWAESLLDEHRLNDEGFFNSELIQKIWKEHLSEMRDWQHKLWPVLMFQSWKDSIK